jgi:molybdate transport system substrate-binding protein
MRCARNRKWERRFSRSHPVIATSNARSGRLQASALPHSRRIALLARLAVIVGLGLFALLRPATAQEIVTVFAAASLKNAIDDINTLFTETTKIKTVTSYAATSALIRQIEQGAPAGILLSADVKWMDYGAEKKLVQSDSRVNLLGNKLALVAPKDSTLQNLRIAKGFDIAKLAGDGRIAVADVKAVPAGRYAKDALQSLGSWEKAEPKLAMAENVRAALALVSRKEAPLGIVYETDARINPGVRVIATFPDGSHESVTYPVALTASANKAATQYLSFLRSAAAKAIFEKYGFTFLIRPTS